MQRTNALARRQLTIGQVRSFAGLVSQHAHHGVQRWIDGIDAGKVGIHHLGRAQLPTCNAVCQIGRRQLPNLAHRDAPIVSASDMDGICPPKPWQS
jgi:hypothetical protein